MTSTKATSIRPIHWLDGKVRLIDQTRLPAEEVWLEFSTYAEVIQAIKEMRIRGAPAIGVVGAYALALAALEFAPGDEKAFMSPLEDAAKEISGARPTGANLAWAIERMMSVARRSGSRQDAVANLITEAQRIQDEDEEANKGMGEFGAELLTPGSAVLTHCNTGALATGGYGTALGIIGTAWEAGKLSRVFATETRPFLQGSRLTAWELVQIGINANLISDMASGQLMRQGAVDAVIVGADRVAANGDVANKIGTYTLAVLAKENGVPFYVAAPTSTIDMSLASGDSITIEERPAEEVTHFAGERIAPEGMGVLNPAFDVTPNEYVAAIVTERGVVRSPYGEGLTRITEGDIA